MIKLKPCPCCGMELDYKGITFASIDGHLRSSVNEAYMVMVICGCGYQFVKTIEDLDDFEGNWEEWFREMANRRANE